MSERDYKSLNRTLIKNLKNKVREVKESEEQLEIFFEEAPAGYFLADTQGRILEDNRRGRELMNYKKEELIGKNIFQIGLLPKKQIKKTIKSISLAQKARTYESVFKDGFSRRISGLQEHVVKCKDGKMIPAEISSILIKIRWKLFVLVIAVNNEDYKKMEEELKKQKEIYEKRIKGMKKENKKLMKKCQQKKKS